MNDSPKWHLAIVCVLCALTACSQGASNSGNSGTSGSGASAVAASAPADAGGGAPKDAAIDAKAFFAKLQSAIQPLVRIPLTLHEADDSTTDKTMHPGENDFVNCDFLQQQTQVDVSLHDDSDHTLFDDPTRRVMRHWPDSATRRVPPARWA